MRVFSCFLLALLTLSAQAQKTDPAAFTRAVKPVIGTTCTLCHNERVASGGLNLRPYLQPQSLVDSREGWDKVLRKIRSGEMPPKEVERPAQEQIDALTNFIEAEYDRIDRRTPVDPGRVVAHRLNRNEYTNTVRDLLGVEFRADKKFPTDDLGYGFDNIGSVLSISPVLMERYLSAAELIASRALGADPLPAKPIIAEYMGRNKNIRRIDVNTVECTHTVEWGAEYDIRFGMPGERPADSKPVELGFWMDGKLLKSIQVETKPSGLVYFDPFSDATIRLYLPQGDHVFRAGFINDDFAKGMTNKDQFDRKKNKYPDSIVFTGPYKSNVERASRKKVLICDPNSGAACVNRIIATLAHHAYRRPVTPKEVASLVRFVDQAKSEGQSVEQGLQVAIEAMLVSPHFLFRIEHDTAAERGLPAHPLSQVELASRLSYFLWSSMPDDELLGLAESGKLRLPSVLDKQVDRLLADPRSAAFAENFAGQWLEVRNLDDVNPDPKKFPAWGPELRDAMKTETRLFFESIVRENRPITDFIAARYTFLNEKLAKHYGISGVTGPDFRRVELTTDQRGGVLTQASVLTVSSYPTRTSVVIRGKYVLQNLLGAAPPPPPPDVPALVDSGIGTTDSMRQQMEKHRSDPMCSSCHLRMDPLGFGLENYDALGKWRTMDGKFPVDATGTLPNGKSFASPAELRRLLMNDLPEFSRCLTEKMLTYALGRGLDLSDQRAVIGITRQVKASGYLPRTMISAIVHSVPFQQGRVEVLSAKGGPGSPAAKQTQLGTR